MSSSGDGGGDKGDKKASSSGSTSDKIKDFAAKFASEGSAIADASRGRSRRAGIVTASGGDDALDRARSASVTRGRDREGRSGSRPGDRAKPTRSRSQAGGDRGTRSRSRSRSRSKTGDTSREPRSNSKTDASRGKMLRRSSSVNALTRNRRGQLHLGMADLKALQAKTQPPKPTGGMPKGYMQRDASEKSVEGDASQSTLGASAFDFDKASPLPDVAKGASEKTSISGKRDGGNGDSIFATRADKDLRQIPDQSVNLMGGNYGKATTTPTTANGGQIKRPSFIQRLFGGGSGGSKKSNIPSSTMTTVDLGPDPTKRRETHFYLQQQEAKRDSPWGKCKEGTVTVWKFLRKTICSAPFLTVIVLIITLVFWIPYIQDSVNSLPAPAPAPETPVPTKAPVTPEPTKAEATPEPTKAPVTSEPTKGPVQVAVTEEKAPAPNPTAEDTSPEPTVATGVQGSAATTERNFDQSPTAPPKPKVNILQSFMDFFNPSGGKEEDQEETRKHSSFATTTKSGSEDSDKTRQHSNFAEISKPKSGEEIENITAAEMAFVERYFEIHNLVLGNNLTSEEVLNDSNSSQYKALHWMVIADGDQQEDQQRRKLDGNGISSDEHEDDDDDKDSDARIMERYVAAVLFFATHNLTDLEFWMLSTGMDGWPVWNESDILSSAMHYWNDSEHYDSMLYWNNSNHFYAMWPNGSEFDAEFLPLGFSFPPGYSDLPVPPENSDEKDEKGSGKTDSYAPPPGTNATDSKNPPDGKGPKPPPSGSSGGSGPLPPPSKSTGGPPGSNSTGGSPPNATGRAPPLDAAPSTVAPTMAPSMAPSSKPTPIPVFNLASRGASNGDNNGRRSLRNLNKDPMGDDVKWLSRERICNWKGIECDDDGFVVICDLSNKGLHGTLPSEIRGFEKLTELRLENNHFHGTLTGAIGSLENLETLSMQDNRLDGEIPPSLGDPPLKKLTLDHNHLTGLVPSELGLLTELTELSLNHNFLSGDFPLELEEGLIEIQLLHIEQNQFTGPLPIFEENFEQLKTLRLHHNNFVGEISESDPLCLAVSDFELHFLTADCNSTVTCSCCHKCY